MYFLYIKTHNKTGLKYLGQTKCKDVHKYQGSGKYWTNHIKKHGYDVTTEIIFFCNTNEELREKGIYYSELWNIVKSKEWANLKVEIGDGGSFKGVNLGRKHSKEARKKISDSKRGVSNSNKGRKHSIEFKKRISNTLKGRTRNPDSIRRQCETIKNNGGKKISEETKMKMRKPKPEGFGENMSKNHTRPVLGCKFINNGIVNKAWRGKNIPEGWIFGFVNREVIIPSQKGKIWVNNGFINKMVYEIPYGYVRGRVNYKR